MKIFTPKKLLCLIGLHDWIYGFDTDKNQYLKRCSRCNKEEKVDLKQLVKKAPDLYNQYKMYKRIGVIK